MLWAFIGTIYLIILTWQDLKNNMRVDDRYNYLMMGMTSGLLYIYKFKLVYILVLILALFLFYWLLGKFTDYGEGDKKSLLWVITGFSFINLSYLVIFGAILVLTAGFYMIIAYFLTKLFKIQRDKLPFYPVITGAFIITAFFFGLYF